MTRPRALGAYIFAGGFTLGVAKHFDVLAHFEDGPYGVATARLNFPTLPIFPVQADWPVDDPKYQGLDWIYGNPPCAAWSRAGVKTTTTRDWRTDPRVDCTRRHFDLLRKLRPKVWVWESVDQTFKDGRELIDELASEAISLGYAVTLFVFDGKYLGLPQRRKRFFFIAHRVKLNLEPPDWSTTTCDQALRGINDIGDPYPATEALTRRLGWLLPHCEPGSDLRKTFDRYHEQNNLTPSVNAQGHVAGRPGFLVRRCKAGDVAPTVLHELVHPTEHRFLTLREIAALCGYPPDFQLAPPASSMNEFSRAVMPPVAEYLARQVARAIEDDEPVTRPSTMVVDYRRPPGETYEEILVDGRLEAPERPKEVVGASSRSVKAAPAARVREEDLPARPVPRPRAGLGRMKFLQVLIMMDRWTTQQLVDIVRHTWPESKASAADVSTQRRVLVTLGHSPPATRRVPSEALPW